MSRRRRPSPVLRIALAALLAVGSVAVTPSSPAAGSTCLDGDLMCGIAPVPETALDTSACGLAAVAMFLEAYGTVPGANAREKLDTVASYVPRHPVSVNGKSVMLTGLDDMRGVVAAANAFGIPMATATWRSVAAGSWFDDLRAIVAGQRRPVIAFLPDLKPIWPTMNRVGHFVVVSGISASGEVIEHDAWDGLQHAWPQDAFGRAWGGQTAVGTKFGPAFQYLDVQGTGALVADHVPGGRWTSPADGASTGAIDVKVHAYPSKAGDPPIRTVAVTAWWSGLGDKTGPWRIACTLTHPISADLYGCTVNPGALGAPEGTLLLSFDVADAGGATNFAPNGVRTIKWTARAATPKPSPRPTPRPMACDVVYATGWQGQGVYQLDMTRGLIASETKTSLYNNRYLAWNGVRRELYILADNGGVISVVDTAPLREVATISTDVGWNGYSIAVSSDGSTIVATFANGGAGGLFQRVVEFDARSRTARHSVILDTTYGSPYAAISPDGSLVYVSWDNKLDIYDTNTMSLLKRITDVTTVSGRLVVSPEGNDLFIVQPGELLKYDLRAGQVVAKARLGSSSGFSWTDLSRDGSAVWVADDDRVSRVPLSLRGITSVPASLPIGFEESTDGTRLFVTNVDGTTVSTIDLATGRTTGSIPVSNATALVAVPCR